MELAVGIITVLLTAFIAYGVHLYRPKIGYELQCAYDRFHINEGRIRHEGETLSETIEIGSLTLKNPSSSDVDDFEIVFEGQFRHVKLKAKKTSTISKDAIKIEHSSDSIRIRAKRFPKKEEILIGYSIIGPNALEHLTPKKADGKFELYSMIDRRNSIKAIVSGLFFGFCLFPIGVLGALIVSFVLDKL